MTPATPDLPAVETQIVEMTNSFRAEEDLGSVKRNNVLDKAADDYARYLAKSDTFAHDADGRQPADRVRAAGYKYCQIAENLALSLDSRGFKTGELSSQMMEGWINSPGHRRNLLAPHVMEIGVSVVRAPDKHPKYISVQLLARPHDAQYTFQVSNTAKDAISYNFAGETHEIKPGYAARHGACLPGNIVFKPGSKRRAKNFQGTYEAQDGQVYVITSARSGRLSVNVEQKRTLSRQPARAAPETGPSSFLPLPERSPLR